ncbi:MAG: outer-membrane lipoprotein carrier protein LolA [Pseudomonadota bacterium]
MVSTTLTALALVWTFGQHAYPIAQSTLQAATPESEEAMTPEIQPDTPAISTIGEQVAVEGAVPQTIERAVSDQTYAPMDSTPIANTTPQAPQEPIPDAQPIPSLPTENNVPSGEVLDADPIIPAPAAVRHAEGSTRYTLYLDRARTALSMAKTASGRFSQSNADGSVYAGRFALSRPGKLRFDYDDPVPVLIVSDGTTVAMEDSDLETIDRVPLGSTPLGLILDDDLKFTDDVIVNSVIERDSGFEITVEDATGEMSGMLTMLFDKDANLLTGWRAVDAEFNTTRVTLLDVELNQRINPRQFILRDAEDEEDER